MSARVRIGTVTPKASSGFHAECADCGWNLNKRKQDDAIATLRSHSTIAHPRGIPVYLEEDND